MFNDFTPEPRDSGVGIVTDPGPAVAWMNISKRFGDSPPALDGVNLHLDRGECLVLLGTSGSGKSTLLKMVNRLLEPSSGEVTVLGKPASEWDPIRLRRSIGYVIQDVGLMPHLSVLANVGLTLRIQGIGEAERDRKAEDMLRTVGLDPGQYASRWPHELSGGQRQRVGVARALVTDPALVLMDEPFGALDPITRREIQAEFRAIQTRLHTSVIFVTHDIREAFRVGDRLAVLDRGRVVQVGTPEELMNAPASDFVKSFLSDAAAISPGEERAA
jgi:osmoprotectant transport system ATP-binding protein